jgi:mannosyltransferase OCH1-like enzyme
MIPKKIHYCWFGKKELTKMAKSCIDSWRKYMPEYEIIEWNESNFDVNINTYTKEAYSNKKYAFVSDFARFYILNLYGGIYLDLDVELIKPLHNLMTNTTVLGVEDLGKVAPGLIIISKPNVAFLKDLVSIYNNLHFHDINNNLNLRTVVEITSEYFNKKGLKKNNEIQIIDEVTIYPREYFCPIDVNTGKITITHNTYSIHKYAASWESKSNIIRGRFYKFLRRYFGKKIAEFIRKILRKKDEK